MRFVKGHGTENDFVIVPDPDGKLDLSPELVAALCDRRRGIGADGVLRVVRSDAFDGAFGAAAGGSAAGGPEWFMDYRNADGSIAEMCGNGARVFARYLVESGLAGPGEWTIGTRGGARRVMLERTGDVSVEMGPPSLLGQSKASLAGVGFTGTRVSVGNPHLVCRVDEPVAHLDLSAAPVVCAEDFPEGANVEFFRPTGDGRVEMRVFERGSGETRSCGTGAVATAAAAASLEGRPTGAWDVAVLGGVVTVTIDEETSYLRGPAVLVAEGEILIG